MIAWEHILDITASSLYQEGGRLAKIKGLTLLLKALKGWRKIAMMFYTAFLMCILFTGAFFSMLIYLVTHYASQGHLPLDAFVIVSISVCAATLISMILLLREKRWLEAFGLVKIISMLDSRNTRNTASRGDVEVRNVQINKDDLRHVIEEVIAEQGFMRSQDMCNTVQSNKDQNPEQKKTVSLSA